MFYAVGYTLNIFSFQVIKKTKFWRSEEDFQFIWLITKFPPQYTVRRPNPPDPHGPQGFDGLHGIRGRTVKNCIFQTRIFQDKTIKMVSEQFTENISNWVENWVTQMTWYFDLYVLLIVSVQNFAKTAVL